MAKKNIIIIIIDKMTIIVYLIYLDQKKNLIGNFIIFNLLFIIALSLIF